MSCLKPVLLGTHAYPARDAAAQRQKDALDSWRRLDNCALVNLQFHDDPNPKAIDGFKTVRTLELDSITATGADGVRKPIVSEMFDLLAHEAELCGAEFFGFSNSDIIIPQETLELVRTSKRAAHILSRTELEDLAGPPGAVAISGQDTYFLRVRFWQKNRHRFRPYVVGETPWDIIYTTICLVHGDSILHNRVPRTYHVSHEWTWKDSPFFEYGLHLQCLDWPYQKRWFAYYDRLKNEPSDRIRRKDEEMLLESFFPRLLPQTELWYQSLKNVLIKRRYALKLRKTPRP